MAAAKRKKSGAEQHRTPAPPKKLRCRRKAGSSADSSVRRSTRLTVKGLAKAAVINTAELLENILVYLPVNDLYVAQRVNHQFKDAIAGSPDLQRKLWIRVDPTPGLPSCAILHKLKWPYQSVLVRSDDARTQPRASRYRGIIDGLTTQSCLNGVGPQRELCQLQEMRCSRMFWTFGVPRDGSTPLWSKLQLCLPARAPMCIRFHWTLKGAVKGEGERTIKEDSLTLGQVVKHIFDGNLVDMKEDIVTERKKSIAMQSTKGLRPVVKRLEEKYNARIVVNWMEMIFRDAVFPDEDQWDLELE